MMSGNNGISIIYYNNYGQEYQLISECGKR